MQLVDNPQFKKWTRLIDWFPSCTNDFCALCFDCWWLCTNTGTTFDCCVADLICIFRGVDLAWAGRVLGNTRHGLRPGDDDTPPQLSQPWTTHACWRDAGHVKEAGCLVNMQHGWKRSAAPGVGGGYQYLIRITANGEYAPIVFDGSDHFSKGLQIGS